MEMTATQRAAALADAEAEFGKVKPTTTNKAKKTATKAEGKATKAKTAPAKKSRSKELAQERRAAGIRNLKWREINRDKVPLPSLHNVRLAIDALGIEVTFDVFRNRMEIGQRGRTRHVVDQTLIGDAGDDRILMLRHFISEKFGFDPPTPLVRDAVRTVAMQNQHNPVCDFLDQAEGKWDGKKRLDRFATEYLNTEDTPLNAAQGRKMMIAMVARARNPGCKFDCIVTLEGDEGLQKSMALRALAGGDDFFSDESIIGRDSREVMEHTAGVWVHESADLAGMSKREIEAVKAWASRQVDRARPAYGHAIREQPRRCIMTATTNNTEYLQSQSGNRRFWPLRVLKMIDVKKLEKDRLQLFGEAATYQAQGESLVLDEALWAAAAVEQEKRRVRDVWEETLAEMQGQVIDGEERVSSSFILNEYFEIPPGQQTQGLGMRLSNVMRKLGWQRHENNNVTIDGKAVKGYFRPTTREPEASTNTVRGSKHSNLPPPRKAKKQ